MRLMKTTTDGSVAVKADRIEFLENDYAWKANSSHLFQELRLIGWKCQMDYVDEMLGVRRGGSGSAYFG